MDFETLRTSLTGCPHLQGLEDHYLGLLLLTCEITTFKEGDVIFLKGEEATGEFFLLLSGEVGVVSTDRKLLDSIVPPQILGEVGVVSKQHRRTATLAALKPCTAARWHFDTLRDRVPGLTERLKDLAWKRVRNW